MQISTIHKENPLIFSSIAKTNLTNNGWENFSPCTPSPSIFVKISIYLYDPKTAAMFLYKLTSKKDTLKTQKSYYYATAIKEGSLEGDTLLDQLSDRTKLHPVDCQRVILHLAELLSDNLLEGKTVTLPDIGIFRATIKSKGVEDMEDFRESDMLGLKVAFLPHKKMKSRLRKVRYKRIKE